MNVPIEVVAIICTTFLSLIGGLILWYLTRILNQYNDLKTDINTIREKKVDKDTQDAQLRSIEAKIDTLIAGQAKISKDISGFGTRVDTKFAEYDRQLVNLP